MTSRACPRHAQLITGGLITVLLWVLGGSAWAVPALSDQATPSPQTEKGLSTPIFLQPGEIRSVAVENVERVAIGDPEVLDVTVVSANELLLQAKGAGTTNLIVWDQTGQHLSQVEVTDPTIRALEPRLRQLISDLKFSRVRVRREHDKLFLIGEVATQADLDRLEQLLGAYRAQVSNLVVVSEPLKPKLPEHPPLVKLTVKLIEISRSDLEKLGVKWSEGITFTEPARTDRTFHNALFGLWGTSVDRTSVTMTLNALVEQKRARVLEEPKLVTVSGKEASSFIGLEVPIATGTTAVATATTTVSTAVAFRSTGILLKITPTVLEAPPSSDTTTPPSRKINTVISTEISGVDKSVGVAIPAGTGSSTVFVPGFKVRKASTEVTAESGETVMIAGLLEVEDSHTISQVPGLGSMPVVGRLFRSPEVSSSQRELVITVTPEVLDHEISAPEEELAALPQAVGTAHVPGAGPSSAQSPLAYAMQIQDRIAKAIRWPLSEKKAGEEKRLKLRLRVAADGTLKDALITESSGSDALDAEALRAAKAQAPFSAFPPELTANDLWIEAAIVFRP